MAAIEATFSDSFSQTDKPFRYRELEGFPAVQCPRPLAQ